MMRKYEIVAHIVHAAWHGRKARLHKPLYQMTDVISSPMDIQHNGCLASGARERPA